MSIELIRCPPLPTDDPIQNEDSHAVNAGCKIRKVKCVRPEGHESRTAMYQTSRELHAVGAASVEARPLDYRAYRG